VTHPIDAYLEQHVSERMRRIVDFALEDRPTWDLCCDNGLIGLWAWRTRRSKEVHFVDRVPLLIDTLARRVREHVEQEALAFHACDAAEVTLGSSPSNVVIAGVGFRASHRILKSIAKATCPHRIVLSVHAEADHVPDTMRALGFRFAGTATVEENGRERTISAWDGTGGEGPPSP
jgi:tRNA A22 N-methylase